MRVIPVFLLLLLAVSSTNAQKNEISTQNTAKSLSLLYAIILMGYKHNEKCDHLSLDSKQALGLNIKQIDSALIAAIGVEKFRVLKDTLLKEYNMAKQSSCDDKVKKAIDGSVKFAGNWVGGMHAFDRKLARTNSQKHANEAVLFKNDSVKNDAADQNGTVEKKSS